MSKSKRRTQSLHMNIDTEYLYHSMLVSMLQVAHEWVGLPEEIPVHYLEEQLIHGQTMGIMLDDDYGRFVTAAVTSQGRLNMYGEPVEVLARATNYSKKFARRDVAVVKPRDMSLPMSDAEAIRIYAKRLARIDRSVDVNLVNNSIPSIILTPPQMRLTVKNLISQWAGGEPIIVAPNEFLENVAFGKLDTDVPYIVDKLLQAKLSIWSEIMTFMGIDNSSIEKAERVQSAEVAANEGQIISMRLTRLVARRRACEELYEKYGIPCTVRFNTDLISANFEALNLEIPDGDEMDVGGVSHDQL